MTGVFSVRGSDELTTLARRLKDAGSGDLRKELLAGIREAGKKVIPEIREAAQDTLPRSGGLAERVASQAYATRTSLALSGAKVSIVGRGMKELGDIDRGRLRHPVYGNRDTWSQQAVKPGFFSVTIAKRAPLIRKDIENALDDIAHKLTRGL